MKKYAQKKYMIPLGGIILIGFVVVMYLMGFRITYAPDLENSWDAISAFADWASVFVSGLAIYYAICVPKKIAEDQNRIALFEKRYEVYKVLTDCFAFAFMLENSDIADHECRDLFHVAFNENVKSEQKYTWLEQMRTYSEVQNKLKMAEHLFGDEIAEKVALMLASLLMLIQTEEPSGDPKKRQRVYIEQSNRVEKECAPRIKELLALK